MEKFLILWSACGYDGDDDYCFGNMELEAIANTREEAEEVALKAAKAIAEDYLPETPTEDNEAWDWVDRPEEYAEYRNKKIDFEEELDKENHLELIRITHYDDMFPHIGLVRIVKVDL